MLQPKLNSFQLQNRLKKELHPILQKKILRSIGQEDPFLDNAIRSIHDFFNSVEKDGMPDWFRIDTNLSA